MVLLDFSGKGPVDRLEGKVRSVQQRLGHTFRT